MLRRCANASCWFDFVAMRAVCVDPRCTGTLEGCTCGTHYGLLASGEAVPLDTPPSPQATGRFAWLCCACAAQHCLVSVRDDGVLLVPAPDAYDFVRR